MTPWEIDINNIIRAPVQYHPSLGSKQDMVLGYIKDNPRVTTKEIAAALHWKQEDAENATSKLRMKHQIRNLRAGTGKPALWVVY